MERSSSAGRNGRKSADLGECGRQAAVTIPESVFPEINITY